MSIIRVTPSGSAGKKNRAWLNGIFGPNSTSGQVPREWLSASAEVNQRTWKFANLDGVDAKGQLANGNYWRYFGMFGESIQYYNVPPEAAAYFDRVIDSVCASWTRIEIRSGALIFMRLEDERAANKIDIAFEAGPIDILRRLLEGYADRVEDQFIVVTETRVLSPVSSSRSFIAV